MLNDVTHLRRSERWIANVRVGAVAFAILQVALSTGYPPGYEFKAWETTAVFASAPRSSSGSAGGTCRATGRCCSPSPRSASTPRVISSYLLIYNYESGTPVRQVMYLAIVEAAVRFAIIGPLVLTALTLPVLIEFERLRAEHAGERFHADYVTFQAGSQVIIGPHRRLARPAPRT